MQDNIKKALKLSSDALIMFARNGRWGTCVDCPKDSRNNIYPEFCQNTARYDHHLDMNELSEKWYRELSRSV